MKTLTAMIRDPRSDTVRTQTFHGDSRDPIVLLVQFLRLHPSAQLVGITR